MTATDRRVAPAPSKLRTEKKMITSHEGTGNRPVRDWAWRVPLLLVLAGSVCVMFADLGGTAVGYSAIALMLVLLFMKVPIGIAMTVPSLLGLYAMLGDRAVESALSTLPFGSVASWSLSVLPLFIFMGILIERSGLSSNIYAAASSWLSWLPGGVAVATNVAGAGLSSISGSTLATTYALGRAGIPQMLDRGYDRRLAVGSVAVASLSGHLIPPSMLLVIYAGVAEVPIGPQLLAGIGPGILLVLATSALIIVLSAVLPVLAGRKRGEKIEHHSWTARWRSLASTWPLPVLMTMVLGGMFLGVFTATEAAAAGALGALILTMWRRRKDNAVRTLGTASVQTVQTVGGIFLLIIGAAMLTRLLSITQITAAFTDWVSSSGLGRIEFLLILLLAYLIMGMFLESTTMILLTVPLLLPSLVMLEIDLLWFGVFVVLLAEIGLLTPPVGILSFIIHGMVRDPEVNRGQRISLADVFVSILWFVPAIALVLWIMIAFPAIATWLPAQMVQ